MPAPKNDFLLNQQSRQRVQLAFIMTSTVGAEGQLLWYKFAGPAPVFFPVKGVV